MLPFEFAANLSMLYQEAPFLSRFELAAQSGFSAVEFLFPYEFGVEQIAQRVEEEGLKVALFNLHPGDKENGEWGTLSNPSRRDYFKWSFEIAIDAASRLGCDRLNMMFGQRLADLDPQAQIECAVTNLIWAATMSEGMGVDLLIEPLNPTDFPSYFLRDIRQALDVIYAVNEPRVGIQFDAYHVHLTEGDAVDSLLHCFNAVRHIQIADAPGRHQPGTGEIKFPDFFSTLNRIGYESFVGLEYLPQGSTEESLGWLSDFGSLDESGAAE